MTKKILERLDELVTRYDVLILVLLSSFLLLFQLWRGSLASWDEAFYALATRGILEHKDWLTLFHLDQPLFNKPPLYMWISALFTMVFGDNEFSIRLFSSLCGVATVILTYFIGKKLFSQRTAFISALVLASSSHFIIFARRGMLDIPLTCFFAASLLCFLIGKERNRYFILSGLFFGLAVMVKGAGGLLIPCIIGLHLICSGEIKKYIGNIYLWLGFCVGFIVFLPWHLYEYYLYGKKFLDQYLFYHVVQRSTKALEGHAASYFYYVKKVLQKFKPWSFLVPFTFLYVLIQSFKKNKSIVFCFVWVLCVMLFYSIVPTKLQWYIIPMYPALAILIGSMINALLKKRYIGLFTLFVLIICCVHIPSSHIFETDHTKGLKTLLQSIDSTSYNVYSYKNSEWPAIAYYTKKYPKDVDDENELLHLVQNLDQKSVVVMGKKKFDEFSFDENMLSKYKVKHARNFTLIKKG